MLELYVKETCTFCNKVTSVLNKLEIPYKEKDIYSSQSYMQELLSLGGKKQIPFLVDKEMNVMMYESDDIIEYIKKNYSKKK